MEYLGINGLTSFHSQAMAYGFPDAAPAALNVVVAWYWMPMPGSYITSYSRWKLKTRVPLDFESFQRLLGTSNKGRQVTGLCTYAKGSPPHRTATCRRTQAMTASKKSCVCPWFHSVCLHHFHHLQDGRRQELDHRGGRGVPRKTAVTVLVTLGRSLRSSISTIQLYTRSGLKQGDVFHLTPFPCTTFRLHMPMPSASLPS